jgi:dihydropteroate synthase-like protein
MSAERIHFVTGRLAEKALREIVSDLAAKCDFEYTIDVLPITVAALMTPNWIAKRIQIPNGTDRVVLPGYCDGDLSPIREIADVNIEVGPKDLRQLPRFFGEAVQRTGYGEYDIEIIAEINHAPRLALREILRMADEMKNDGANIIDVGCEPDGTFWPGVGECIKALKDKGFRISIDSLNPREIEPAVNAGAELVLSVNARNRDAALDWGCEVVVIPDDIQRIESMEETIDLLAAHQIPLRIDPIIEPIGLGFATSIHRYFNARQRWPEAAMMMGIGNISELTDCDSAGINVILLALCQELRIGSVLTTQVINWARSSVKECDLARKLVFHANEQRVPAKHVDSQLVMLRDAELLSVSNENLAQLAEQIKDNDYRLFADGKSVHLVGKNIHLSASDPFEVFDGLAALSPKNLDPSHAFYLGFELCKALTANTLGKQYTQDEALNWGFLTDEEGDRRRLKRRTSRPASPQNDENRASND